MVALGLAGYKRRALDRTGGASYNAGLEQGGEDLGEDSGKGLTRRGFLHGLAMSGAAAYLLAPWGPRLGSVASAQPVPPVAPAVSSEQVATAIRQALAYLRDRQGADGRWADSGQPGGGTALTLLAMLNAGLTADDPAVARGLEVLHGLANSDVYVVSLKCMVLAATGRPQDRAALVQAVQWLVELQNADGMWGYSPTRRRGDNSNTQFALLGLHEAAKAGMHVPRTVWQRSHRHFMTTQLPDGGWTYVYSSPQGPASYGSMTAAGVASLFITGEGALGGTERGYVNGGAPGCGIYQPNRAVLAGIRWLAAHFSVQQNPRRGSTWHHYYLYALERVGMAGGLARIGPYDWFRHGAAHLVQTQRAGGGWGDLVETNFALLFLAKGIRPILFQKLQYAGHWNPDRHDLENLTTFISDQLGQPVSWQAVPVDADVREWLTSPVLFVQGHEFPTFTAAHIARFGQFVEAGGTLVFEACCSRPAFAAGFTAFAQQCWPQYELRALPPDHPVFHARYSLDRTHGVMGLDVGCRTSVFFLPNDVSCLWEQREVRGHEALVDFAFRFGTNLAAYATGAQPLGDRLVEVHLPESSARTDATAGAAALPARGAVEIVRLAHGGDWNADPHALVRLAELASAQARVDMVARDRGLRATDPALYDHPVALMTSHYAFELPDEEVQALRTWLQRGGLLLAEACCGREVFDQSFRALAGQLLDGGSLEPVPADHPVYAGPAGQALGPMRLRDRAAERMGRAVLDRAPLEQGLLEGRTAILYSPLDFTCGLQGDKPYACAGYVDEDAQRLALHLLLYAVSY